MECSNFFGERLAALVFNSTSEDAYRENLDSVVQFYLPGQSSDELGMQTRSGAKAAPAAKDSERTYGREEISSTVQSALYSIGAALLAKIAASERPACEAVVRVTVGKEAQAASLIEPTSQTSKGWTTLPVGGVAIYP